MIRKTFLASVAVACLWASTLVAGVLYDCTIADHEKAKGWISPKIAIVLPNDTSVKIVDAITLSFDLGPSSGTVLRNNTKRLVVKWTLEGVKADNGTSFAGVNYRASISKATGAISVTTIPKGYDTGLRASGECTSRTE